MKLKASFFIIVMLSAFIIRACAQESYHEMYRPQIHFSPKEKWINDPNGMIYYNNIYHLFFQYYPDSTVWGPMHWGHAISKDLIHWQQQPVALYPDSLGYIFSGSAVLDKNNTSGFGKNGQPPLIAVYTQHDTAGEKARRSDFQNQSIAYSINDGKTWIKFSGNPVLKNPGITDFRDPKVMWFEAGKKWIMTLATKDRVTFYSSTNLKSWVKESEFGNIVGAHGGVWECPDLFPLDDNGKQVWVLIVSLNPGGFNGGSATQYFIGDFNGKNFTPNSTNTKWLDYGPDDYAGVTWSNTGNRKIFLGWMSNWLYANTVPTGKWRNEMTLPRELKLKHVNNDLFVASEPVTEMNAIETNPVTLNGLQVNKNLDLSLKTGGIKFPCSLKMKFDKPADFSLILSNDAGEKLVIGYDKNENQYFIDRTKSGKTDFQKNFAGKHVAPRLANNNRMNITLIIEASSVELFADDGLSVMTEIYFPSKPYNHVHILSAENISVEKLIYRNLKSIW